MEGRGGKGWGLQVERESNSTHLHTSGHIPVLTWRYRVDLHLTEEQTGLRLHRQESSRDHAAGEEGRSGVAGSGRDRTHWVGEPKVKGGQVAEPRGDGCHQARRQVEDDDGGRRDGDPEVDTPPRAQAPQEWRLQGGSHRWQLLGFRGSGHGKACQSFIQI